MSQKNAPMSQGTSALRPLPQTALELVKKSEGLRLTAYKCPAGIWTIGYGHTGPDVRAGMVITPQEAFDFLLSDLAEAAAIIAKHVKVPLTEGQYAALLSFVFNVGAGKAGEKSGFVTLKNGNPSTLLRVLNAGSYDQVPTQLMRWTHDSTGQELVGLVERRGAECKLWNTKEGGV